MLRSYIVSASLSLLLFGCGQLSAQSTVLSSPEISQDKDAVPGGGASEIEPESKAETVEKLEERQPGQSATASLSTVVNVRLLDDTLELSESQVNEGSVELSISNETTDPLTVQIIKTALTPENIVVKNGQVDSTQAGVEIFSQLPEQSIAPGAQENMLESLDPGMYKIVVTAADRDRPVAYTELLVVGVI